MSFDLVIEHTDGTESRLSILDADSIGDTSLPSLSTLSIQRQLQRAPDETDSAQALVHRAAWTAVEPDVDDTNDTVVIEEDGTELFGGRFRDWEHQDATVSVLLDGVKRDAIDAEPSGGNDLYGPKADDAIVTNDILPRVDTISAGTVTQQDSAAAFSESHASPGKSITKLARDTGSEVRYTPGFALEYVAELGSTRGTILAPDEGTIEGDPRVQTRVREEVSHVRVLGAQEGTAQIQAEATANSYDPSTDRAVWRKYVDKEIQQESRAQSLADQLVAEYDGNPEYLEIEVAVPATVSPSVGDTFPVQLPEQGIDTDLRVVELERMVDTSGDRYRLTLSNRTTTRERRGTQTHRNLEEFREGNAGQILRGDVSIGFDPIDSGEDLSFTFRYPSDVVAEFDAVLLVESQTYRGRVISAGHTHSVTIPDHTHSVSIPDHTHSVTIGDHSHSVSTGDHSHSVTLADHTHSVPVADHQHNLFTLTDDTGDASGHNHSYIRPSGEESGESDPIGQSVFNAVSESSRRGGGTTETSTNDGGFTTTTTDGGGTSTTSGSGGSTTETTSSGGGTTETTDQGSDLAAGVNEFPNETVSNVSVDIDGTTVASGLGHPIDEQIDVTGQFSAGNNTVTISSDSLGEVRVAVVVEVLKNAGAGS